MPPTLIGDCGSLAIEQNHHPGVGHLSVIPSRPNLALSIHPPPIRTAPKERLRRALRAAATESCSKIS